MSTPGGVQYTGGYHEYSGNTMSTQGVFSTPGDIMSTLGACHDESGDIMSTLGNVQYAGGYHEYTRGLP